LRLRWNLSKWKYQATALQERKLARDLAPSQDEASPVLEQKPRDREGWVCLLPELGGGIPTTSQKWPPFVATTRMRPAQYWSGSPGIGRSGSQGAAAALGGS
jgi:hypothetical protein